jgi:hypothetical protein
VIPNYDLQISGYYAKLLALKYEMDKRIGHGAPYRRYPIIAEGDPESVTNLPSDLAVL